MSYLGSPPASQFFAPGTDTFSGTGSQTAFTLSRNVATVNDILVVVNNVDQQPTAYTVSVSTLTFSAAPSAGTNNIYVRYLSTNLTAIVPQYGSVVPSSLSTPNALYWDTSGNVGIGTTTPHTSGGSKAIEVANSTQPLVILNNTAVAGRKYAFFTNTDGSFGSYDFTNSTLLSAYIPGASGYQALYTNGTECFRISGSGVFSAVIPSGSTLYPAYLCRAWVNFNGTGTVAIRASGNVTSITDNGTGDYTVNFTTAMPDANYNHNITVSAIESSYTPLNNRGYGSCTKASSSLRFVVGYISSLVGALAAEDEASVQVAIFR